MLLILVVFIGALGLGLNFHGPGHNLPLLLYASVALGLAAFLASVNALGRATSLGGDRRTLLAFVFYVAWLVVCVQTSVSVESSFHPFWNLLALPLAFVVVRVLSDAPVWRARSLIAGAGLGAVVALWALAGLIFTGERNAGPFTDPNNLAAFLNMMFFAALGCHLGSVRAGEHAPRLLLDALLAVLVLGLFASVSRVGIGIWFLGTSAALIGAWRWGWPKRAFAISGASAFAGLVLMYLSSGTTTERFVSGASYAAGIDLRLAMANSSFAIFLDHPWTGAGLQTFRLLYPQYRSLTDQTTAGNFVHNDYLQFLQDGGIVLLAFLLVLVGWVAICFWRRLRTTTAGDATSEDWLALGALAGSGTLFVHALANFSIYVLAISMLLGALLALGFSRSSRSSLLPVPSGYVSVALLCAAMIGGWFYLAVDAYAYVLLQQQPGMAFVEWPEDSEQVQLMADRLDALNSNRGLPVYALATVAAADARSQDPGLVRQANDYFEDAIARDPLNPRVYVDYAVFSKSQGRSARAESILVDALEVDPTDLPAHISLTNLYLAQGRREEAYRHFRERIWPWTGLFYHRYPDGVAFYLERLAILDSEIGNGALGGEIERWRSVLVSKGYLTPEEPARSTGQ
ncbi:MAG: O-antigen ligase family protein [Pseudomonadales bacterium]